MTQPQPVVPRYDVGNQLTRIQAYLIPGETLYAVWDCKGVGTGFVGVTDQRLIFFDQSVLMFKHKSMVSIPYHQIVAVASADEGVIFKASEMTIMTAATKFSFEFRGADKAHWTYQFVMNQILNKEHPQMRG